MLCVRVVAMLGLVFLGNAAAAEAVFRCEGKDGRVTYSDAACPSDSRAARKLEDAPPVTTTKSKTAPRDAREAGQIAQSRNGKVDATQESRQLEEQIDATRRDCFELSRRVEYARRDFEGATPSLRSTAELALRRAQDQHALLCPRQ
jgi:Domain of unknown function (DUF4124)